VGSIGWGKAVMCEDGCGAIAAIRITVCDVLTSEVLTSIAVCNICAKFHGEEARDATAILKARAQREVDNG